MTNLLRPSTAELRERDFDAAEALLIAQGHDPSPTSQWSTAALLMTLAKVARTKPNYADGTLVLSRYVDGTSAFAFLAQRGVDPKSLLQYGFGKLLLLAIDTSMAVNDLEGGEPEADPSGHFTKWQGLRRAILEPHGRLKNELKLSKAFQERLRSWIANGEIADILCWTPPAVLPDHVLPERQLTDSPESQEFKWFVERFTKTYLTAWTDESLALEYRYVMEGWQPACLPTELFLERNISAARVCQEISSRAVHGKKTNKDGQIVLVERALEAIGGQRRDVAAAIFTAARAIDPTDDELANNLGFCLIPDNPEEALRILAEARTLGRTSLINFANTAAAYFVMGDLQKALEVCDEARAFGLKKSHVMWLWDLPVQGEPVLIERSPAGYICDLAVVIATTIGAESVGDAWKLRREYLYPASSSSNSDE